MVSVAIIVKDQSNDFYPLHRSEWQKRDFKMARQCALNILDGVGASNTDIISDVVEITFMVRRLCAEIERRAVAEPFLSR